MPEIDKKEFRVLEVQAGQYKRDQDVVSTSHSLTEIDQKIEEAFPGVPRNELKIHLKRTPYIPAWRRAEYGVNERICLIVTRA